MFILLIKLLTQFNRLTRKNRPSINTANVLATIFTRRGMVSKIATPGDCSFKQFMSKEKLFLIEIGK